MSTQIDRLAGLTEGVANKAPCRVATVAEIGLLGLQTIDGVALASGDRVLVKDQTNPIDNGIWIVSSGAWSRSLDCNGSRDAVDGTTIFIKSGTANGLNMFRINGSDPISVGASGMTFSKFLGTAAAKDVGTEADKIAAGDDIRLGYTRSQLAARAVPAPILWMQTAGYSAAGDGGGGRYARVSSEPSHPGKVQSADGAWWEITDNAISIAHLGAKGDAKFGRTATISSGSTTLTDANASFSAADVGKTIYVGGGGDSSGDPLITTIAAVVSATEITLADAPSQNYTAAAPWTCGTDNSAAMLDALAVGEALGANITIPRGRFMYSGTLDAANCNLVGDGVKGCTLIAAEKGQTGINVRSENVALSGFTLEMLYADHDYGSGSGIILHADYCDLSHIQVKNANRQGFTGPSSHSSFVGLVAVNCRHRGFNFSEDCCFNQFVNIMAIDCRRSGFLLGLRSNYNQIANLIVDGFEINPAISVHSACRGNQFSQVIVRRPIGTGQPHIQLAEASLDNTFTDVQLYDVNNRAIHIYNTVIAEDPTSNGPNARNVFRGVKMFGTGGSSVTGVYFSEDDGGADPSVLYGINSNEFHDFYIDGFDHAVRDTVNTAENCIFNTFRFANITNRRWFMPTGRGHRTRDYPSVTDVGALASATTELPAQPTYSTGADIANPFPFSVEIVIVGHAGTGAQTRIASASGSFVATLASSGNGFFRLGPGQRIEATQGATGTGSWRWFANE